MEQFCDLHIHSCFSDGTFTPTELIRAAEDARLGAVALCDHNTVAGLREFLDAAKGCSVEAVPGIEFSTDYCGKELHILGLFIEPEHYGAIRDLLAEALCRKEESNRDLIRKLAEQGLILNYDALRAEAGGTMNRAVIGAALVRKRYCANVEDAFDRWLNLEQGFFVPPKRPDAFAVIRFIKSVGAVAVLAHPFLNLNEKELRQFLSQAEGLDGMEVYYSQFTREETELAAEIAEEFGLVKSGGSDFHGANKPTILLGWGKGALRVPMECFRRLKMRKRTDSACETEQHLL